MKKLDTPLNKDYGPLVLWAGDIRDILSIVATCKDVEFVADHVQYDTVDEFVTARKGVRPREVRITAFQPYLSVVFRPLHAYVNVSSSKVGPSGIFHQIDTILSAGERKPRALYRMFPPMLSTWVWSGITTVFHVKVSVALPVLGTILAWWAYVVYVSFRRMGVVYPAYREDRANFFQRNQDTLAMALISALIGAILGAVATKMADRVWPTSPPVKPDSHPPQVRNDETKRRVEPPQP